MVAISWAVSLLPLYDEILLYKISSYNQDVQQDGHMCSTLFKNITLMTHESWQGTINVFLSGTLDLAKQ